MIRQVNYANTASSGGGGGEGDMTKNIYDQDNNNQVDAADNIVKKYIAGKGGVNAYQPVYLSASNTVLAADGNNVTHCGKVKGIALNNAAEGVNVKVLINGSVVNPAWNMTPGATLWIGNGAITEIAPLTGFKQSMGNAVTTTKLDVSLGNPIKIM